MGCAPEPAPDQEPETERPNILLILADDLGYGDLGVYNPASRIPTPNLDRLGAEGMRLTDAHSPSSVCTPTRYALLTGRYAWRSRLKRGVLNGRSTALLEPERVTLPAFLRTLGYATAGIGKWHLGLGADPDPNDDTPGETDYSAPLQPGPITAGFEHYFGIPASLDMEPYLYIEDEGVFEAATETVEASSMRRYGGDGYWRAGDIAPGFDFLQVTPTLFDRASGYLEQRASAGDDRPFFLYLPLPSPHTPWMPLPQFEGASDAGVYGDFVAQVDAGVGRLLGALDSLGLASNTLVLFTSDNGAHWLEADIEETGHRANGALRGQKADIHEGGHRVPFLARWPARIPAGAVREELAGLVDVFRTVTSLLEVDLPEGVAEDSVDLGPVLRGEEDPQPPRGSLIHHSSRGMFAIRSHQAEGMDAPRKWKLIEGLGSGGFTQPRQLAPEPGGAEGQLYELVADPAETKDLYLARPDIVERLTAELEAIRGADAAPLAPPEG
ncbi:MAG: arylsulfatase [Holophagales bacterium]|nr:arylsulfatase [Holophagales bacterium]MYG31147.1 arylsulfatase [Holophagales bacterium]MYI79416.1 arylsulfatase [Holophagales bacterium]